MCKCKEKEVVKVKIKKLHENAVVPSYAKDGDAGMDMTCVELERTKDFIEYKTGIAMEIPEGYMGLLFPRSSNSKKDLLMCNSVGIVDAGYRGPINFRFKRVPDEFNRSKNIYELGERVGQIVILPFPQIEFEEVEELNTTERGENGFGHSGV